jgi:hypothetical protein
VTHNPFTHRASGTALAGRVGPMTDNQRSTLISVMLDKATMQGKDREAVIDTVTNWVDQFGLDGQNGFNRAKKQITDGIEWLKTERARVREGQSAMVASQNDRREVSDGFYEVRNGGVGQPRIVKVQTSPRSGRQYAKVLDLGTGQFNYAPGVITEVRRAGEPLSIERARELGALYGRCVCCGATLTDEVSIKLSIGPVCGGRLGGDEFKALARLTKRQLRAAQVVPPESDDHPSPDDDDIAIDQHAVARAESGYAD